MAGCGGDAGDGDTVASSTTARPSSSTTTVATTTSRPETTEPEAATTIASGPLAPLTGAPSDPAADLDRPALVVKIDNHRNARPQIGLDQADLVFDVRAEGVTRFAAVFHSRIPDAVGPVRSSRTSDFDLLAGLDHPLYASSGGNDNVMAGLRDVPVYEVTAQTHEEYYRDRSRPAPHNLLVDPADLFALAPGDATAPSPWFAFRPDGQALPATAEPVGGQVTVAFTGGPTAGFTWDDDIERWLRTQDGQPHLTSDGDQIAIDNVVVMVTTYGTSAADQGSPEVRSTGQGELVLLTAGHAITGTWERASATDKPILLDEAGHEIPLTPGQTWVLYPQAGQVRY